jgi:hypothetical protein
VQEFVREKLERKCEEPEKDVTYERHIWQTFSSWRLKSRCWTEERIFKAEEVVLGCSRAFSKEAAKLFRSNGSMVVPELGVRTSCPPLLLDEMTK